LRSQTFHPDSPMMNMRRILKVKCRLGFATSVSAMHLGSIECSTYTNNAAAAYIVRKARCPETGGHADILDPTDTFIFMLGDGGLWDVSARNSA
jgi:hypothetical protein